MTLRAVKGWIVAGGLLFLATTSTTAQVIDDHFTGDSGGIPATWMRLSGVDTGPIVEAGSVVTVTDTAGNDDGSGMVSTLAFDLSLATSPIVLTVSIDSLTGSIPEPKTFFGFANDPIPAAFVIRLERETPTMGSFRVSYVGKGERELGMVAYNGGAIDVTLTMDADSYSVTTNNGFDSGDIAYADDFDTSPITDLGETARVALITNVSEEGETVATATPAPWRGPRVPPCRPSSYRVELRSTDSA